MIFFVTEIGCLYKLLFELFNSNIKQYFTEVLIHNLFRYSLKKNFILKDNLTNNTPINRNFFKHDYLHHNY